MNDLDSQIAKAKGWRLPTLAECERLFKTQEKEKVHLFPPQFLVPLDMAEHPPWTYIDAESCTWSTSDTLALKLVDELRDWCFELYRGVILYTKWQAAFLYRQEELVLSSQDPWVRFDGEGPTRPEAICRAYIAAKVWQAQKSEPEARYRCPACKSEDLAQKTGGHLGPEETNPFGARCGSCGWTGTIGQTVIAAREWMKEQKG